MSSRSDCLPDFIIVGAMKCGTSTLAAQLGSQNSVFMTTPKEPNFFSDDDVFARGMAWYQDLFAPAEPGMLKGEASTHYTKLPTYPDTVSRLQSTLPDVKIVYLIRNPMTRAISHFIHEWSQGVLDKDVEKALTTHPEIREYGCYGAQIRPFVEAFGREQILLTSLEQLQADQDGELNRIAAFLGVEERAVWNHELSRVNASSERIRTNKVLDWIIANPVTTELRRRLVPQALRSQIRKSLTIQERPEIPASQKADLRRAFEADRLELATYFPGHKALDLCYPSPLE